MPVERNRDAEAAARRMLTRLIDSIEVGESPAPIVFEDLRLESNRRSSKTPARRVALVAAAAVATVAGAALGATRLGDKPGPSARGDVSTVSPGERCVPRVAEDGVAGSGELPDGQPWRVEVRGEPPDVEQTVFVGGQRSSRVGIDPGSWQSAIDRGSLTWGADAENGAVILHGDLPPTAVELDVQASYGETRETRETLRVCTVTVPGVDAYRYVAVSLAPDTGPVDLVAFDPAGQVVARGTVGDGGSGDVEMAINEGAVELPLGNRTGPPPPTPPTEHEVAGGDLPSGRWSLKAGGDATAIRYGLQLPGGGGSGVVARPDQVLDLGQRQWEINPIDGGYFVWGVTPSEVTTVSVTLAGGRRVSIPTLDPGVAGYSVRLFAAPLPEGQSITDMQGLNAAGAPVVRVVELAEMLQQVEGPNPRSNAVGLLIERVN